MVNKGKERGVQKSENLEDKRNFLGEIKSIFYSCFKVLL